MIFYLKKFKNINEIANYPDKAYFVEKTRLLIQDFTDKAIENISCLEDNQYKRAVIDLCKLYSQG